MLESIKIDSSNIYVRHFVVSRAASSYAEEKYAEFMGNIRCFLINFIQTESKIIHLHFWCLQAGTKWSKTLSSIYPGGTETTKPQRR